MPGPSLGRQPLDRAVRRQGRRSPVPASSSLPAPPPRGEPRPPPQCLLGYAVEDHGGGMARQNLAAPAARPCQPAYDLGDVQYTGAWVGEHHVMRCVVAHQREVLVCHLLPSLADRERTSPQPSGCLDGSASKDGSHGLSCAFPARRHQVRVHEDGRRRIPAVQPGTAIANRAPARRAGAATGSNSYSGGSSGRTASGSVADQVKARTRIGPEPSCVPGDIEG